MTTAPAPSPAHAPPRTRGRPRPAARRSSRGRTAEQPAIFGGVFWIVLLAALLAGVVAINVALLQLNVRLDSLSRERQRLRADNAALSLRLSTASDPFEIEALVRSRLRYVRADPLDNIYVDLRQPR
jgi:hypothetical protein